MKKIISISTLALLVLAGFQSCNKHEIDNEKSNNKAVMEMTASSEVVVLDESKPDEVALTISWTPAYDYGDDYVMTYKYQYEVTTSTVPAVSEYEDSEMFERQYTNAELQKILTGRFEQLTSSYATLLFTASCTYSGPRLVIPDESSVRVKVKTYGPKQFKADKVYMDGTAMPNGKIELSASAKNADLFVYNGKLRAGKFNFPVVYGDENNAVVPADMLEQTIGKDAMNATMKDASEGGAWLIDEEDTYRVTLNFASKTVTVLHSDDILELDSLMLAGSAVGAEAIKFEPTVENASVYAFRSELKAGKLYIPVMYDGATSICIVPSDAESHDIKDGSASAFGQVLAANVSARYWNIPADGTYRIVLDLDAKNITIYSAANDLKNTSVTYNNTAEGINPYTMEVTELWMYGGFNGFAHDAGLFTGYQVKYLLRQSLANPNIFVYYGSALPRNTNTDDYTKESHAGVVNFKVKSNQNNVYAYGSTAEAERNKKNGYYSPALGESTGLVAGQSHNRYAYFCIPEGCNYVEVNIEKLTVVFDKR